MAITSTWIGAGAGNFIQFSAIPTSPPVSGTTIPVGSYIIIAVADSDNGVAGTPADSQGNVYAPLTIPVLIGGTGTKGFVQLFYCVTTHLLTQVDSIFYTSLGSNGAAVTSFYLSSPTGIDDLKFGSEVGVTDIPGFSLPPDTVPNKWWPGTFVLGIIGIEGSINDFASNPLPFPPNPSGGGGNIAIQGGSEVLVSPAASVGYFPTLNPGRYYALTIGTFFPKLMVGVSATGAVGTLGISKGFIGVFANGAVGESTANVAKSVISVSAQSAVTTQSIASSVTLTGVSATGITLAPTAVTPQHGPADGTYSGEDQRGRWLEWREQQWRKKQAQRAVPVVEIEPPPVPHVHVIVRSPDLFPRIPGSLDRLRQQMSAAGPIIPQIAPIAPVPPPPPTPMPAMNNVQSQLDLLHRLMTDTRKK